jgi:putative ABC transport system ATP-binding protein
LGFIFQTFNLMPTLNALDNVLVPLVPSGYGPKEMSKAKALLTDIGLGHRLNNRPNQLSGGERQRVAISRAFINDPKIVLADEPTGNLDSKKGNEIFEYLRKLNEEKGVTFVIVTHDTEYIRRGDHVFTMKDGRLNHAETTNFYVPKKQKVC